MARYRLASGVPLLVVRDRQGKLQYHYAAGGGGVARGPLIDWLGDDQRENWLRLGLVEQIDDEPAEPPQPPRHEAAEAIDRCLDDLDRLGLPAEAGAPAARKALRDNGARYGNDAIAAALRERKASAAQPART
jgi:hypothetical protein